MVMEIATKIREARLEDSERVLELFNSDLNLVGGGGFGYKIKHINEFITNPVNKTFVFEEEDNIVGLIQCQFWEESKYVYINDIIVDKSYRKKGIGFALQQYVEELAKENEYEFIYLFSEKNNLFAHKLFYKGGFEKGKEFIFFSKILK